MSFISEVITLADKVEISTVINATADLSRLIAVTKGELLKYLEEVYVKFSQPQQKNENFCNKLKTITTEIFKLHTNINEVTIRDIGSTEKQIVSCKKSLSEAEIGLDTSNRLIEVHEKLIVAKALLKGEEFVKIIQHILQIDANIDNLCSKYELEVLNAISDEVEFLKLEVLSSMRTNFDKFVKYYTERSKTYFKINTSALEEILLAYGLYDVVITPLNDITKFMWDHIFCPMVNCKVSVRSYSYDNENILEIEILSDKQKSYYKDVFENFKTVLDYFDAHFKYTLREDLTSLQYIGNDLNDNLSELLIKNCLSNYLTIPKNSDELQKYDVIVSEIDDLQQKLISTGIFSENMTSLLEYANNVEVHFINRKCESYLMTAMTLMKKGLHEMVEVGTPPDLNNPFKVDERAFQLRSISKSCMDLVVFAEKIMEKIIEGSLASSGRLYCTVQKIFHQYGNVVYEHHVLQTIPHNTAQIALFHNNCIFLAYKLSSWNVKYSKQISFVVDIKPPIFGAEISTLEFIGNQVFSDFLEQQIKQMEQIMKESGLTNTATLQELEPTTEKCVRQCLRQQELLRTVWHKVLCCSNYNNSIGMTLDFLCNFIINAVLKYEDISLEAGEHLVDVLKVIIARGPKLFTDNKDVFVFVKNWYKLNELVFVLSSSLVDIGDRWADGKGPLALQFKPEELKQLIRAFFQNNDRRAAILAKITKLR